MLRVYGTKNQKRYEKKYIYFDDDGAGHFDGNTKCDGPGAYPESGYEYRTCSMDRINRRTSSLFRRVLLLGAMERSAERQR